MVGDVAQQDGKPIVHAHMVVGRSDGSVAGGHLLNAVVRPTCEVLLTELTVQLSKDSTQTRALYSSSCRVCTRC